MDALVAATGAGPDGRMWRTYVPIADPIATDPSSQARFALALPETWAWRTTGDEAKRNHGHGSERVYRTIPEFRRNPIGVHVDATGKLLRDAEGGPERSGFHSRAAIVGYRLHPDTDAVPVLSPNDVWRLAYPATDSDLGRRLIARDRGKVVRQLRKPEEAGHIELVNDGRGGLQIFESDPNGKP